MTQAHKAALRIALIREEFSESDILEAVRLLEEAGTTSALFSFLARRETQPRTAGKGSNRRSGSSGSSRSRALMEVEKTDPEKFRILDEFERLIRLGTILPDLEDIRKLGERLSKRFVAGKSRKETIGRLMALIADLPLETVRQVIKESLSSVNLSRDSGYQDLANFIIRGRPNEGSGEHREGP
jgi:hypothetical protein